MQNFTAVLELRNVVSDVDAGPYWVRLLGPNGTVANTGESFATRAEAIAFAAGLDMMARQQGVRVIFDDVTVSPEDTILRGEWPVERDAALPLDRTTRQLVEDGLMYVEAIGAGWRRIGLTSLGRKRVGSAR